MFSSTGNSVSLSESSVSVTSVTNPTTIQSITNTLHFSSSSSSPLIATPFSGTNNTPIIVGFTVGGTVAVGGGVAYYF